MKIRHLSASSVGTWDLCNYAYKLSYVYKMKGFPNSGAMKGTICHSVFEDIANGLINNEKVTMKTIYESLDKHYHEIKSLEENKKWITLTSDDYNDCKKLIKKVIDKKAYGFFEKKIVGVEKKFDIIFSKYGEVVQIDVEDFCEECGIDKDLYIESFDDGSYRVYGFIDLITEYEDTIELLDWKTGKTNKKGKELQKDVQLRLYTMVAKALYPNYTHHLASIWYLRSRICTMGYTDEELRKFSIEMSNRWADIKNSNNPRRTIGPIDKKWKCRFCAFKGGKEDCDIFWLHDKNNKDLKPLIVKAKNGESLKEFVE